MDNAAECVRGYTHSIGSQNRSQAWILSPLDTWERNPYYNGPANPRHPEDESPIRLVVLQCNAYEIQASKCRDEQLRQQAEEAYRNTGEIQF